MIPFGLFSILMQAYPKWALIPSIEDQFLRGSPSAQPMSKEALRSHMVNDQIRARGIRDSRVLKALATVPRHAFVLPDWVEMAYCDRPLPIGYGQTISQPYIVAYMTELAQISQDAVVLEIGTGSGYQTAILGVLAKEVYSVEVVPELAKQACHRLNQLGYANVHIKTGDGYHGWAYHAPYDAILVTAAPPEVPQALIDQLALNGKLVVPVGDQYQSLLVITKTTTRVFTEETIPVRFVPMVSRKGSEKKSRDKDI
jgi:protein-L-isoaspartate(D-aspartate) O-methyltransferase